MFDIGNLFIVMKTPKTNIIKNSNSFNKAEYFIFCSESKTAQRKVLMEKSDVYILLNNIASDVSWFLFRKTITGIIKAIEITLKSNLKGKNIPICSVFFSGFAATLCMNIVFSPN